MLYYCLYIYIYIYIYVERAHAAICLVCGRVCRVRVEYASGRYILVLYVERAHAAICPGARRWTRVRTSAMPWRTSGSNARAKVCVYIYIRMYVCEYKRERARGAETQGRRRV